MPTFNEVAALCKKSPIEFTPQAQLLVYQVLASVTDDPHPGWKTDQISLTAASGTLFAQLPSLLAQVASHPSVQDQRVTTFDVLHWLASTQPIATKINLDRLCPFDK
jgi:hypothetical protein